MKIAIVTLWLHIRGREPDQAAEIRPELRPVVRIAANCVAECNGSAENGLKVAVPLRARRALITM
ncbi:MAG: hypothetical protein EKK51_18250 [Mycolicibacterium sp.]|uniref:hypothetical protein n=1 Tax=Mycolicibacterium sp. TaxID=2320850 RepID=UPI000FA3703C|nr:hypothetical protein [Mycolicibacterium sp.]RUP29978.1 MAG: hypothetical protein EKK51_18250 [Mycolicibacterium sp.]